MLLITYNYGHFDLVRSLIIDFSLFDIINMKNKVNLTIFILCLIFLYNFIVC
jgi:hypothetical protein